MLQSCAFQRSARLDSAMHAPRVNLMDFRPSALKLFAMVTQNVQAVPLLRLNCVEHLHYHELSTLVNPVPCNFTIRSFVSCMMQPSGDALTLITPTNQQNAKASLAKPCDGWFEHNLP